MSLPEQVERGERHDPRQPRRGLADVDGPELREDGEAVMRNHRKRGDAAKGVDRNPARLAAHAFPDPDAPSRCAGNIPVARGFRNATSHEVEDVAVGAGPATCRDDADAATM